MVGGDREPTERLLGPVTVTGVDEMCRLVSDVHVQRELSAFARGRTATDRASDRTLTRGPGDWAERHLMRRWGIEGARALTRPDPDDLRASDNRSSQLSLGASD